MINCIYRITTIRGNDYDLGRAPIVNAYSQFERTSVRGGPGGAHIAPTGIFIPAAAGTSIAQTRPSAKRTHTEESPRQLAKGAPLRRVGPSAI